MYTKPFAGGLKDSLDWTRPYIEYSASRWLVFQRLSLMTMITLIEQGLSWYWCLRTIAIAISIKYIMVLLISLARHNLTLITKTAHRSSPETHSVDCYEFFLVAMNFYEPSHCPSNKLHAGISMYTLGALLYTNDAYSAFSDRHKKFLKYFWKSERKSNEKWQFWALYVEG